MEELISSIAQSTFSIAVAAYLLVRMESRIDRLSEAIVELRRAIEQERRGEAGR